MKILWIATYGGNYNSKNICGTGGWVAPLETELANRHPEIELGIVFIHKTDNTSLKKKNVTYFPIKKTQESNLIKYIKRISGIERREEEDIVKRMSKVIDIFNPDIVHVWGSENYYARIIKYINKPVVIHIQGLASSILNVYMPHGFTKHDLLRADGFINSRILYRGHLRRYKEFQDKVKSELSVAKKCRYWIGRTDWDKQSVYSLNPKSIYFHCDELLRSDFFTGRWKFHYNGHFIIQSTVSNSWYKGVDSILKTAKILIEHDFDFEWNVCGISHDSSMVKSIEEKIKIKASDVNVNFLGSHPVNIIKKMLLKCDAYVHPSHIENSSNAICEAMLLGVPVVAEYVGGNPSMLKNNSGILVQPYDPYCMAFSIIELVNEDKVKTLTENAIKIASERHNPNKVVKDLISAYQYIINDNIAKY